MGAPNVSSAMETMSIARTTPAQKPRGFIKRRRFSGALLAVGAETGIAGSKATVLTLGLYRFHPSEVPEINVVGQFEFSSKKQILRCAQDDSIERKSVILSAAKDLLSPGEIQTDPL